MEWDQSITTVVLIVCKNNIFSGGRILTSEERKQKIFSQSCVLKEVYVSTDHFINGHVIVKGPDGRHLFYNVQVQLAGILKNPLN